LKVAEATQQQIVITENAEEAPKKVETLVVEASTTATTSTAAAEDVVRTSTQAAAPMLAALPQEFSDTDNTDNNNNNNKNTIDKDNNNDDSKKSEMYIPQDVENPIIIYHGGKDGLVLGQNCEGTRLTTERTQLSSPLGLVRIHDADHSSVMSDFDNLTNKVMRSSLLGEADETGHLNFSSLLETRFDQCLTNRGP
jgi:hypothetical protein